MAMELACQSSSNASHILLYGQRPAGPMCVLKRGQAMEILKILPETYMKNPQCKSYYLAQHKRIARSLNFKKIDCC